MCYPDDHELTELFYQVVRQLENLAKSSHKNMNFFSGQYKCLFLLDEAGTITQRRLSHILEIRSTSLSEILSKLEKKGYITRTLSETDKRTYIISVTSDGRKEAQRVRSIRLKEHHELTDPLSDEDKYALYKILEKIKEYYTKQEDI